MTSTQTLDNPLWAFSLRVYGAPNVADECLALQERLGLDVNLLLLAAYMGAVEGVALTAEDIAGAADTVAAWHESAVRALRDVRRALKPPSLDENNPLRGAIATLRLQTKAAELEAERIEQAMLWSWSRAHLTGRSPTNADGALAANLSNAVVHYGGINDRDNDKNNAPRLQAAALTFAGAEA